MNKNQFLTGNAKANFMCKEVQKQKLNQHHNVTWYKTKNVHRMCKTTCFRLNGPSPIITRQSDIFGWMKIFGSLSQCFTLYCCIKQNLSHQAELQQKGRLTSVTTLPEQHYKAVQQIGSVSTHTERYIAEKQTGSVCMQ